MVLETAKQIKSTYWLLIPVARAHTLTKQTANRKIKHGADTPAMISRTPHTTWARSPRANHHSSLDAIQTQSFPQSLVWTSSGVRVCQEDRHTVDYSNSAYTSPGVYGGGAITVPRYDATPWRKRGRPNHHRDTVEERVGPTSSSSTTYSNVF